MNDSEATAALEHMVEHAARDLEIFEAMLADDDGRERFRRGINSNRAVVSKAIHNLHLLAGRCRDGIDDPELTVHQVARATSAALIFEDLADLMQQHLEPN